MGRCGAKFARKVRLGVSVLRDGVGGGLTLVWSAFAGGIDGSGAYSATFMANIGGSFEACRGRTGVTICEALPARFEESAEFADRAFPRVIAN